MKNTRSRRAALRAMMAVMLFFTGLKMRAAEEATIKVGDRFPDMAEVGIAGDWPRETKGRLVIVGFWASWCGPCRGTFPLMEDLHRRLGKRGLVIIAVNEDKSRVAMAEFLRQHPVTFINVRDSKKKLAAAVNVALLPASYILDGDGRVVAIQSGERTMQNRAAFAKLVEDLLEKHVGKKP